MDTDEPNDTSAGEPRERPSQGPSRRGGRARRIGPLARARNRAGRASRAVRANAGPALRDTGDLAAERASAARQPLRNLMSGLSGTGTELLDGFFEAVQRASLAIERPLSAALVRLLETLRRTADVLMRELTPARVLTAVLAVGVVGLVASQATDYRAVSVGTPEYEGVGSAAPAPLVNRQDPTSAHGIWIYAIAALAAVLLVAMIRSGRGQIGRVIALLGIGVIAIALAVDVPASKEFDEATRDYVGASPELLGGFWAQLAAGSILLVGGLARAATGGPEPARSTGSRREREAQGAGAGGTAEAGGTAPA